MATGSALPVIHALHAAIDQEVQVSIPPEALGLLLSNTDVVPPDQQAVTQQSRLLLAHYMAELAQLSTKVQEAMAAIDAIHAPIRRLPAELIIEVFRHAKAGSGGWNPFDVQELPWVLGQVCRRWRNIALSLSELWASLTFQVGDRWSDRHTNLLMECLRRSDKPLTPLSINFTSVRKGEGEVAVLDLILKHSTRLVVLSLSLLPDPVSYGRLLQLKLLVTACGPSTLKDRMPSLVDLKLEFREPIRDDFPLLSLYTSLPHLRELTLCRETSRRLLLPHPHPILLPLNQYEHLTYTTVVDSELSLLRVLAAAPNLMTCRQVFDDFPRTQPTTERLTHTKLRDLQCLDHSIQGLTLPNLHYLDVHMMMGRYVDAIHAFLCDPSHRDLRELRLWGMSGADDAREFATAFSKLPNLVDLDVFGYSLPGAGYATPASLCLDTTTDDSQVIIPKLETISFSVSSPEDLEDSVGVLEARFELGNRALKSVVLACRELGDVVARKLPRDMMERFERMGIDLSFTPPYR